MEYCLLKAWVDENPITGEKIEACFIETEKLIIRFKGKRELVFLKTKSESYLYLQQAVANSGSPIWQALHHSILGRVQIADDDRTIQIDLSLEDIYGEQKSYVLIFECSPGFPNAILCKKINNELFVIDALEKYSLADNPQRQVLPNLPYYPAKTTYRPILKEIMLPIDLKLKNGEHLSCPNLNDYLSSYYDKVIVAGRIADEQNRLLAYWQKEIKRVKRKIEMQEADLAEAERMQDWFVFAEAIKYQLNTIKTGDEILIATDWHDPSMKQIKIPLLKEKSPLENMNYYLRKYHKARKGKQVILDNIKKSSEELITLEGIVERVLTGELIHPIGKGKAIDQNSKLREAQKLLSIRISADFELVIGRKARENDFITTQLARPTDWWFHTRIYHGSHILLRCLTKKNPEPDLIALCCSLAAWYSKAKFSQNVPVDYTQIRFVRKPRKSPAGFVIYTNHHTVYANPMDLRSLKEKLGL